MSLGTGKHGGISKFLERTFDDESAKMGRNWTAQKFSVGIRSPRGGRWDTSRVPDVVVLPIEQWEAAMETKPITVRVNVEAARIFEKALPSKAIISSRT
jgi:hypothetical protein